MRDTGFGLGRLPIVNQMGPGARILVAAVQVLQRECT